MSETYQIFPVSRSAEQVEWTDTKPAWVIHPMGDRPQYFPKTELRLQYDAEFIYGKFSITDKYVRSRVTEINGPVSEDSCVEFFFAPNAAEPLHYFNLEINAGGTPLMFFIKHPWSDYRSIDPDDIRQIDICSSMPQVIDPEIADETEWSVEFRISLLVLRKYAEITEPGTGVIWRANFYKTATETSNPHYLTWNPVAFERPNFHLPEFFGRIEFK